MAAASSNVDESGFDGVEMTDTPPTPVALDPRDLRPGPEAVARYLAGADYRLAPKMRQRVEAGIDAVVDMVKPVAAYRVVSADQIRDGFDAGGASGDCHEPFFDTAAMPAPCLAVYLATLGAALDTACRAMADRDQFYQSMLLDAVGTAMLDAMGAELELLVTAEARRRGLFAGCRMGPGLNGMALENQALLFTLLNGAAMGVRLNAAYVMQPTKTISAFIFFDTVEKKIGRSGTNKCRRCRMKNCQFRLRDH